MTMGPDERSPESGGSSPTPTANDIRRFESAVWSLYTLSDNPSLPVHGRAACRLAADHAVRSLAPGDPRVAILVSLVIEVGAGEPAPDAKAVLVQLKKAGVEAGEADLAKAPDPLKEPPPPSVVSDAERRKALDRVYGVIETHLKNPDLTPVEATRYRSRLDSLRTSPADVRSKTEIAWALLNAMERSLHFRTRKTGGGS